jgi:hypothetical protein
MASNFSSSRRRGENRTGEFLGVVSVPFWRARWTTPAMVPLVKRRSRAIWL